MKKSSSEVSLRDFKNKPNIIHSHRLRNAHYNNAAYRVKKELAKIYNKGYKPRKKYSNPNHLI